MAKGEGAMTDYDYSKEQIMDNILAVESERNAAAEAMRPEGLTDDEWRLVRRHRAAKAEEARRVAAWAPAIEELNEACDGDDDAVAWDQAAALFVNRAGAHGSDRDLEIENFAAALMRATGHELVEIRNHGSVWKATR
jgi:hypothetical protein